MPDMPRVAASITLSDAEQAVLRQWSRGRRTPTRLVRRARIVLRAADGWLNTAIAADLGIREKTVGLWRRRFSEQRTAGIEKDAPGRGRPATVQRTAVEAEVLRKTTQERPPAATHWSTRTLAATLGISPASVRRIWTRHGLKPHLVRTFKVSNDPHFADKLEDIVGLYLNPPANALVFSVDEKSQIQALDRTQPGLPIKKGRAGTMTHDYKRHGTTTLFAALCTLTGHVLSTCMPRHRHQEWIRFLNLINPGFPFCLPRMAPYTPEGPPSARNSCRRTFVQLQRPSPQPALTCDRLAPLLSGHFSDTAPHVCRFFARRASLHSARASACRRR